MRNKEVDDKFLLIQHSIIREKSIAQLTAKAKKSERDERSWTERVKSAPCHETKQIKDEKRWRGLNPDKTKQTEEINKR